MEPRRTTFYLDKANSKWLGVCAGIADYTGIDLTVIRIVTVLSTLFLTGGTLLFAYLIIAWMAPVKPYGLYQSSDEAKFWQGVRQSPSGSTRDVRSKFRDIDRRLADVETYYTSRNSSLANEIDSLR
jgi:phage shock protein C